MTTGSKERTPWPWLLDGLLKRTALEIGEGKGRERRGGEV